MPDRFRRMTPDEVDGLREKIAYQPDRLMRLANNVVVGARLTTDSSGDVTFTFPTAFSSTPAVQVLPECTSGAPYFPQITAISTTAVTIRLYRGRALPTLTPVSGVILDDVIDGVNAIVTELTAYNTMNVAVGAGVVVHVYAMRPTS